MMAVRNSTAWLRATALVLLAATPALAVTDADRNAVYKDFRAKFDGKLYADAQPLAEKLVQLTEEQFGAEELVLSTPLANLATVHYKLGNYPAAIENYQRSLRILQSKSTLADKQQIRPLHGLGVSFLGARDAESAVVALKRATDLSRNTDGLFNLGQVEFIDPLIQAYYATGRYAEAEKETQYALRVEEAAYGRSSVKLLGRLEKVARWYEADRRFTTERAVYERALALISRASSDKDPRRVGPLRGIARSFRLESIYGIEGADTGGSFNAGTTGAPVFADGTTQRRGEASLSAALAIVDSNEPVDQRMRGEVLTDLGDWFLVSNGYRRAYESYADAWKSFSAAGDTHVLEQPRILAYRPSISSVDRSRLDPEEAVVKAVEMHFAVDRDGRIDNVTSTTKDVPEDVVRNAISSMRRTRYAPRIENGAAVPTSDVTFVERVLVRVPKPAAEQAPQPAKPVADPVTGEMKPAPAPVPPSQ